MSADLRIIINKALSFIGLAAFLSLMMGLIFIDVVWMNNAVHEASFTECAQEIMLGLMALLFFWRAWRSPSERSMMVLAGGFFCCMLIREMDFLFDEWRHGSWFWFALAVALSCLAIALRKPATLISGLATFMRHPAWNMMAAGMITILVFSRLFGMHELWQHLMLDGYNRTVKNMAEEGSELLGYSLCLFATFSYLWQSADHAVDQEERTGSTLQLARASSAQ